MSNKTYIETLIRICDDIGITYRIDYSGRAMYGRKCFAVESDHNVMADACKLAAAIVGAVTVPAIDDSDLTLEMAQELLSQMTYVRSDNMGLGSIMYWPDLDTTDVDQLEFDE